MQKRASMFVTRNYTFEEGSMTGILAELKWEPLQKRRQNNRLILLYKGLKSKVRIPTDDLIQKIDVAEAFQDTIRKYNTCKHSFFPTIIRDWNDLPVSLITSAEMSGGGLRV